MPTPRITIIGAGPGGAFTALKLSYMGIPCTLIDRATFPRDKVCGDAISGKAVTLLHRLDPQILHRFQRDADRQLGANGISFFSPNGRSMNIPITASYIKDDQFAPGYVSKRVDFDHFLIEEVRRRDNIDLKLGIAIENYEKTDTGFTLSDKSGEFTTTTELLIVANGAHSSFSRHYAGFEKDPAHHAAAVRAYYKNVKGLHPGNYIELHFLKELMPGYFWIFGLPNGQANVGLGMRTDVVGKKKVNLKKKMEEVMASHPNVAHRFTEAEPITKITGYGLPLGSKKRPISGDHYMMIGDAAYLIDPVTGEGIGNAMYSGWIAAEHAALCLEQNNFSAEFMKAHDTRVDRVLGPELRLSYRFQKTLAYPRLLNFLVGIGSRNEGLINLVSRMFTDIELRKQILSPRMWGKVILGKKVG